MPYVADYKIDRCLDCGSCREVKKVHEVLKGTGLTTVICQTEFGHIGPQS